VQTDHNGGYGYGNNVGIRCALKSGADYVLVLNNDTAVDPEFLGPMVYMCEADKSVGTASGKIFFFDKSDIIWFNGGRFNPRTGKLEHINFNEKDTGQNCLKENTFISGCMWLVPRRIFESVGFINEEYFMYVEDLEFCKRVLDAGFRLRVCEKSHVWHKDGETTGGEFSKFSIYWRGKNINRFIATHMKPLWRKWLAFTIVNSRIFMTLAKNKKYSLFLIHAKAISESVQKKGN